MTARDTRPSPSPSMFGYTLGRRGLLKGAAGAAALGLGLPAGLARAQVELGTATGEVTLGSNYSDARAYGGSGRRGRGVSERERQVITQHGRPQHVPGEHHHLPAEPGRRDPLVRGLPHAVLRRPGSARPHRRRLGGGSERPSCPRASSSPRPGKTASSTSYRWTYYCLGHPLPPERVRGERVGGADDHGQLMGVASRACSPRASSHSRSATTAAGRRWARSTSSTSA